VNISEAVALIDAAVPRRAGAWVDVGAGSGLFTRALIELLGHDRRIVAIDRDARAVATLERWARSHAPHVIPVVADFARRDLPRPEEPVQGILLANALHFVRDPDVVLARLAAWLRPGGRVVLVEYDRRRGSPWVPYPIPIDRLPALAASAGLSTPVITATRPSAYGGTLYVAASDRPASTARTGASSR